MDESIMLAKRMKESREEKGLKQKELAEKIGVTPQTISAYEKNGKVPTLGNVIAIAKVLDVSVDWLCGIDQGGERQKTLKTLADVAEFLHEILSWQTISAYESCRPSSSDFCVDNPGIIFDADDELGSFISDSLKMKKLLKDTTFSEEFYDRWVADRLRSLSEIDIIKLATK